jgi:carboxymethylenebutenolidase
MQKAFLVLSFILLAFFSGCDSDEDSDQAFKNLSRRDDFKNAHENPLDIGKMPLTGAMIHFPVTNSSPGSAYLVKSRHPTNNWLFVYHEWWGLNDYIKKESDNLANDLKDINVLALDLYDGKIADNKDDASKLVNETNEKRINRIIDGAISYIGDSGKLATVGWCFGGGWSLQTAILAGKKDIGCVIYYGMPESDMAKIAKIECPVLGIFAKNDKGITPEMVSSFETRMRSSSKAVIIKSYNADHAFANPSNPHYNKNAAAEARQITLNFLKNRFSGN